jgi:hypothetical protein
MGGFRLTSTGALSVEGVTCVDVALDLLCGTESSPRVGTETTGPPLFLADAGTLVEV